jgi:hypothetical protein
MNVQAKNNSFFLDILIHDSHSVDFVERIKSLKEGRASIKTVGKVI